MTTTLRLPRWDAQAAERLAQAGIGIKDAPLGYVGHGIEVRLDVAEGDPVDRVRDALHGWTVLLPRDFVSSA